MREPPKSPSPKSGFWSLATLEPDRVAVIETEGRRWTAGELHALANRLVHGLRELGLPPQGVIAAATGNRAEFLALLMAALQASWYFLPLNPLAPDQETEGLLRVVEPRLLIYDQSFRGLGAARSLLGRERCLGLGRDWQRLCLSGCDGAPPERAAGAILSLTSGSTGHPRMVKRPLSGLSPEHLGKQAAVHLKAVCGIEPRTGLVHLVASPLYHSASLLWCADHLQLGHTVVLSPAWEPEAALRAIEAYRVTGSLMVPTHFRRLLDLPQDVRRAHDVSSLRHVVHTGAACPLAVKRAMLDWWGPVLTEVYGAAEGPGTRIGPEEWLLHPGSVGRAHGRARILRDLGGECAVNEVGEVHLKLPGGFASVGDLGYLDDQDYLFLVGRKDDVIICAGVNIHPLEIEEVLGAHPAVLDCAVTGHADPDRGQSLHALVVPRAGSAPRAEELAGFCRDRLSPHKCPREFELVQRLPRDEQGKLRRRELRTG